MLKCILGSLYYSKDTWQGWQTSFPVMVAGRPCSPAILFCCGPYIRVCHSVICATTSVSAKMCVHYLHYALHPRICAAHECVQFSHPMHITFRNSDHHGRPSFASLHEALSGPSQELLRVPEESLREVKSPEMAAQIGADGACSLDLYLDLQRYYCV